MEWKSSQARYEGARRSPLHGSMDVASPTMMQQPRLGANEVSPYIMHSTHYVPTYYNHYWNGGYYPHGYTHNCLPSYESPPPPPQHPHYIQVSPDARLTPPKDSFKSESPETTRAAGCTCKKSRYVSVTVTGFEVTIANTI